MAYFLSPIIQNIKTSVMKKIIIATFALVASLCTTALYAQDYNQEQNYIEVSARVEKQITPDIIYLDITISEQNSKAKNYLETKEKEMIKALQTLKIDVEKSLTVKDMNSNLKQYFLKKDNILATKSYILKVNTADEVAAVFDILNSIGISDVSLNKTSISPELEKQVKDELLASAAKKTKENATILAEAVGSKAGKAIYIQNYYNFSQPTGANFALKSARSTLSTDGIIEESIPSLEINKSTVSVNVTCRFEILP